jgi:hypothetical protein
VLHGSVVCKPIQVCGLSPEAERRMALLVSRAGCPQGSSTGKVRHRLERDYSYYARMGDDVGLWIDFPAHKCKTAASSDPHGGLVCIRRREDGIEGEDVAVIDAGAGADNRPPRVHIVDRLEQ